MKKVLLLILIVFFFSSCEKVYICRGPKAEVYHEDCNCRGLKKCSKSVDEVSIADAKRMGRRPCQICVDK